MTRATMPDEYEPRRHVRESAVDYWKRQWLEAKKEANRLLQGMEEATAALAAAMNETAPDA